MNIIEIQNLFYQYPDSSFGLHGINLCVRAGELLVIAGTNGSGKTTLLRHLNGLILPDSGSVNLAGKSVSKNLTRARQLAGMVFQDSDSQSVGETVFDDVAFGPENLCLPPEEIKKRVTRAMTIVGISHLADSRPHTLSGGEKRKLAIAGVLAMNPKIIAFDEPFSGLDYPGVCQILKQILALHNTGHTIIITTHDIEKIIAHAGRLIFMEKGKIVRQGTPDRLISESETFGVRQPCASKFGMEIQSWLN